MKAFENAIMLYFIIFCVIFINLVCSKEFDGFLQSSKGETIIGLSPNIGVEIDQKESLLIVCGRGDVYSLNLETNVLEKKMGIWCSLQNGVFSQ